MNLAIARVGAYRNFCNKLWNATRFAFLYLDAADGQAPFRPAELPAAGGAANLPLLADARTCSAAGARGEQTPFTPAGLAVRRRGSSRGWRTP